ncbi:fumarylacetoacetate hydrolase family protein [Variovorax sp. WS11]|uniref:fumarylacetoacetate hydrolase family protein n=1 Tax=Variovorax sp. WS11 TaxID=1105204 RepID=UPI0031BAA409
MGKVVDGSVYELTEHCASTDCLGKLISANATLFEQLAAVPLKELTAHPLSSVQLLAPVTSPSKFLAIGLNYQAHADESLRIGVAPAQSQIWFNKQVSCIVGPGDAIDHPAVIEQLDYEAELGLMIGRRGRNIRPEDALDHVAGYMIVNDVSARDWQKRSPTWTLGKSFDTHGPIGPWLVTPDEIGDPHSLAISLKVNGELRQQANTSQMIHDIRAQLSYLSEVMTLEPGDIIATGTPAGVGVAMTPPQFLKEGDVVTIDIERVGQLSNPVRSNSRKGRG